MIKPLLILPCLLLLAATVVSQPVPIDSQLKKWHSLSAQPVNEESFRESCDLIQQIGAINIDTAFGLLKNYLQLLKPYDNERWTHVLLMSWARAAGSLGRYGVADSLYHCAFENAHYNGQPYREALVNNFLLQLEFAKYDSLEQYFFKAKEIAENARDNESLSFLHTFRALALLMNNVPDSVRFYFDKAIGYAGSLTDKNALFTAKYNYANIYLRNNPPEQVMLFMELLELAKDSTLIRYPKKLYERTAFSFRNARPSVFYQLAQLNLMLADFDNASEYARLFYDATVTPNPNAPQAPMLNAEMALIKAYQQQWASADTFLKKSLTGSDNDESSIYFPSYFIAAGLISEHAGEREKALQYFKKASASGTGQGLHFIPASLYYANALVENNRLKEARSVFDSLSTSIKHSDYTSKGLFFSKFRANYYRANGEYRQYAEELNHYNAIKDSLEGFGKYRAIQELQARFSLHEKQQQINLLNKEKMQDAKSRSAERYFYLTIIILAFVVIILLVLYLRSRKTLLQQQSLMHEKKLELLEREQQEKKMQIAFEAGEQERNKIAGILHDDVHAMVTLAVLNLGAAMEGSATNELVKTQIKKASEAIQSAGKSVRALSHRLAPALEEKYGFRHIVEDVVASINLSGKIRLQLYFSGFETVEKYPAELLPDLIRIMQELLQNIILHSSADTATLQLVGTEKHVSLMIEDNGRGIEKRDLNSGFGLKGIRRKLSRYHGEMEISGKDQRINGTLIVIEIKL